MKEYQVSAEVIAKMSQFVKAESLEQAKESLKDRLQDLLETDGLCDSIEVTNLKAVETEEEL